MIISRSIHGAANGHISFFFMAEYYALVYVPHGLYLVAVYELLIAVASLVTEHQLRVQASVVTVHGLTCPKACGIFPDQGSNPYALHWQVDSYPLDRQGSHDTCFLMWVCLQSRNFLSKYLCSLSFFPGLHFS